MIKYFHELWEQEIQWLIKEGTTYANLDRDFPQPPWCGYPGALHGMFGCWPLWYTNIKSIEDCKNCELCKGE